MPKDWRETFIALSRATGWQPAELMRMTWSEINAWIAAAVAVLKAEED